MPFAEDSPQQAVALASDDSLLAPGVSAAGPDMAAAEGLAVRAGTEAQDVGPAAADSALAAEAAGVRGRVGALYSAADILAAERIAGPAAVVALAGGRHGGGMSRNAEAAPSAVFCSSWGSR